MNSHQADPWIAKNWMGKTVRQTGGIPSLIGRVGRVEETFFDEKGALHCRSVGNSEFWCPASLLEIQP
jgi:hypothetical protein